MDQLVAGNIGDADCKLSIKKASFVILQVIALLKYYQANGVEEITNKQLEKTIICFNKESSNSQVYLISPNFEYITNVSIDCQSPKTTKTYSLCECIRLLVQNIQRKLQSNDLIAIVEKIVNQERAQSLSIAKTLCEALFFSVPLNFETQSTLALWLDIQRTKYINTISSDPDNLTSIKNVFNYYYMLFLTRSDMKILFYCINQLRDGYPASSSSSSSIS